MQLGRKIIYDKISGNVLVNRGEMGGGVRETTLDEDFQSFVNLQGRTQESVGMRILTIGQYAADFEQCSGFRVNPTTETIEFSYPDPNAPPEAPPVYRKPLSEEVATLKERDMLMQADISAIIELLGG